MSAELEIVGGPSFKVHMAKSMRTVIIFDKPSDLEKLLALALDTAVCIDGEKMPYKKAKRIMGPVVAYFSNASDYLNAANSL